MGNHSSPEERRSVVRKDRCHRCCRRILCCSIPPQLCKGCCCPFSLLLTTRFIAYHCRARRLRCCNRLCFQILLICDRVLDFLFHIVYKLIMIEKQHIAQSEKTRQDQRHAPSNHRHHLLRQLRTLNVIMIGEKRPEMKNASSPRSFSG